MSNSFLAIANNSDEDEEINSEEVNSNKIVNDDILDLNNLDSIINYLLYNNKNTIDKEYFNSISEIEKEINNKINEKDIEILFENSRYYDKDIEWINNKYKELYKFSLLTNLISKNVLEFYKKMN